ETALVLTTVLYILMGTIEFARLIFVQQILQNAVREGARWAVVNTQNVTSGSLTEIQNLVDGYLGGQGVQLTGYNKTTNITAYRADPTTGNPATSGSTLWTDAQYGDYIGVKITGSYKPILPAPYLLGMPGSMTLTAEILMYSEAN